MPTDKTPQTPPLDALPPYPYATPASDEIDLWELCNAIWRGKWIVISVTTVFAVASVFYALSLPDMYQSKVLLAPSEDAQGGGMSRMAGQLGGLASLAGISIGRGGGDDKVAVAIAILKSRKFITDFVEQHNILPKLMAVEGWNRESDKLVYDGELYDLQQEKWVREVSPPKSPEPSSWEAYKAFMNILNVSQEKETGFVTVSIEHQSPVVAKQWVSWLVDDVNAVMKEKDMSQAERSIEFLQTRLSGVALADMRTVFYQLIEEQTKTIMLSEARKEYTFATIDPPVVAEEKAKPKRVLLCLLGVILGGMVAVVIVIILHFFRATKKVRSDYDVADQLGAMRGSN